MKRLAPWTVLAAPIAALVTALLAALLAAPAGAVGAGPSAPRPGATDPSPQQAPVVHHAAFSPNGDGVHDLARVRFTLPEAGPVTLRVKATLGDYTRRVRLGRLAAGRHVWTWNGRAGGRVLPQGGYLVTLRTSSGVAQGYVALDLRFDAVVRPAQSYGRPRSEAPAVYPRTRVVEDTLGLLGVILEDGGRIPRSVLLVRDDDGAVVARRDLVEHPTGVVEDGWWRDDPMLWDARDRRGRPLPPGRYTATVVGTDHLGNRGASRPLRLWVSERRLTWVEETRQLRPQDVAHGSVCGTWSSGNGCGDVEECGPVLPSALFPGGLSHQGAASCPYGFGAPGAESDNWLEVPEAVRGIAAARLSFTGAPTRAGGSDTATLSTYSYATRAQVSVTSGTGASTDWVQQPWGWLGTPGDPSRSEPRVSPSVVWSFTTSGTDSFDVASYTVDLRYLAVAD